jgi:hypothetical protein
VAVGEVLRRAQKNSKKREAPHVSIHANDRPVGGCVGRRCVDRAGHSARRRHARAAALPYGDDAACSATHGSYQCTWTSRGGSSAEALQGVAADIASCLPDATHDQNSPSRQHFYLGARGQRTQIVVATAGANKLKLVVSGNK